MKIIVFIRHVKHIYAQTGKDPKENHIGPDDIVRIINPFDEYAIEAALKIKESISDVEVITVSLGDRFAVFGLMRSLELGADKAIHIHYEHYEKLDAWATALALAYSVKNSRFRLVFCGREAIDDNAGLVGAYIAEILKISYMSRAVKIEIKKDPNIATVYRAVERGRIQIMECDLPALFTVDKGIGTLRYPVLPGILMAQKKAIETLVPKDLELPGGPLSPSLNMTEMVKISRPKPRARSQKRTDSRLSASERMKLFMKGGHSKQKEGSKVMVGISDSVFQEMELIMKENGVDL